MSKNTRENDIMARYLLGQLPEAEQEAFEERLFSDEDCVDQLSVVEMELIDDYLQGRMSATRRKEFENGFLTTPDRIKKLANAKALMRHVIELKPVIAVTAVDTGPSFWTRLTGYLSLQGPVMQYAMAGFVLLLTVLSAWLVYDSRRQHNELLQARNQANQLDQRLQAQRLELQRELEQKQAELQRSLESQSASKDEVERLNREIQTLKNQRESLPFPQNQEIVTTALSPTLNPKGGLSEATNIYIPTTARSIRLRLSIAPPVTSRFTAVMNDEKGRSLQNWSGLRPIRSGGDYWLVLRAPTRNLIPGQTYTVKVFESAHPEAPIGSYLFRIVSVSK